MLNLPVWWVILLDPEKLTVTFDLWCVIESVLLQGRSDQNQNVFPLYGQNVSSTKTLLNVEQATTVGKMRLLRTRILDVSPRDVLEGVLMENTLKVNTEVWCREPRCRWSGKCVCSK